MERSPRTSVPSGVMISKARDACMMSDLAMAVGAGGRVGTQERVSKVIFPAGAEETSVKTAVACN
jgi:hypothetical protein